MPLLSMGASPCPCIQVVQQRSDLLFNLCSQHVERADLVNTFFSLVAVCLYASLVAVYHIPPGLTTPAALSHRALSAGGNLNDVTRADDTELLLQNSQESGHSRRRTGGFLLSKQSRPKAHRRTIQLP